MCTKVHSKWLSKGPSSQIDLPEVAQAYDDTTRNNFERLFFIIDLISNDWLRLSMTS